MNSVYASLHGEIERMPVIDTHEHLIFSEEARARECRDVLAEYLIHYLRSDVVSAGLSQDALREVTDPDLPIAERWKLVEPYWEASRFTGYGQALDIAARGIYGIDGVNGQTIEALNEKFLAAAQIGHYRNVLKELCNIEISLLDTWLAQERLEAKSHFFLRVFQPTGFIMPQLYGDFLMQEGIAKRHGINVKTLEDWLEVMERELDWTLTTYGAKVIKTAIAYHRSLRFEDIAYRAAEAQFDKALEERGPGGLIFPAELQDYLMHQLMRLAQGRHLTVQFHTGLLEGNGNTLANSDPALLNNLFLKYPGVDFDLFHISFPYQGTACALCKMFPNVFIDMCWAHIISPRAAKSALLDFLDAVPYNKISAFGGDYCFVDGVYGHLVLARQNVARALAQKVEEGTFGEDRAVDIARALFYDNPKRIFKLG
jgi:predicted TIM-barrel fold metal-dependent hydrolase